MTAFVVLPASVDSSNVNGSVKFPAGRENCTSGGNPTPLLAFGVPRGGVAQPPRTPGAPRARPAGKLSQSEMSRFRARYCQRVSSVNSRVFGLGRKRGRRELGDHVRGRVRQREVTPLRVEPEVRVQIREVGASVLRRGEHNQFLARQQHPAGEAPLRQVRRVVREKPAREIYRPGAAVVQLDPGRTFAVVIPQAALIIRQKFGEID